MFGHLSNFEYVPIFQDGRAVTVTSNFGLKIGCFSFFFFFLMFVWYLGTQSRYNKNFDTRGRSMYSLYKLTTPDLHTDTPVIAHFS